MTERTCGTIDSDTRGAGTKEEHMGRRLLSSILSIIYFVVGVIVASSHKYFVHLSSLKPLASAVFAVLLWPLVLLGINLHIR
jgi:membrane protein YdbS with pleckstrin-like domain